MRNIILTLILIHPFGAFAQTSVKMLSTIEYILEGTHCNLTDLKIERNGLSDSFSDIQIIKNDIKVTKLENCFAFKNLFLQNVKDSIFQSYDISNDKLLTKNQVAALLYRKSIDVCEGAEVTIYLIEQIKSFTIIQDWLLNENGSIQNKVISITPNLYDENGGKKPLFKVKFDNEFRKQAIINEPNIVFILKSYENANFTCFQNQEKLRSSLSQMSTTLKDDSNIKFNSSDQIGYNLVQLFYVDLESMIINSQLNEICLTQEIKDSNGNFKYYERLNCRSK